MYNGALIDADKMDLTNQEVATAVKAAVNQFFVDAKNELKNRENDMFQAIEKLEGAYTRSDVERVEKKKSILSNILFIIGSAFSPELTPTELYGKQHMSKDRREKMENFHKGIADRIKDVNGRLDKFHGFLNYLDKIQSEVLSDEQKLTVFIKSAANAYRDNQFKAELVDTGFFFRTLVHSGYVKESEIKELAACGINLRGNTLQSSFARFNEWYVKSIGSNTMQK